MFPSGKFVRFCGCLQLEGKKVSQKGLKSILASPVQNTYRAGFKQTSIVTLILGKVWTLWRLFRASELIPIFGPRYIDVNRWFNDLFMLWNWTLIKPRSSNHWSRMDKKEPSKFINIDSGIPIVLTESKNSSKE